MNNFLRLLQNYNIKSKMKDNMIIKKQRFNDSYIMEDILNTTIFLTNIKRLNACRLYIGTTFLSEISNIKGSVISTRSLIGNNTKLAKSNHDWYNQKIQNKATWLL